MTPVMIIRSIAVMAACALLQTSAWAQEALGRPPVPEIRVSAEAIIPVQPDRAQIDLGVITEARTAQAAAAQNAQRLETTLAALRKLLGPDAQIKTVSYALDPVHTYPKPGGPPAVVGYTASNTVRVTTDELAQAGRIVDTAMEAGANTIHRLAFTLKDEQPLLAQALGQAAAHAREKAKTIAASLGVKIVRVLRVEESGVALQMAEPMTLSRFKEAGTPIEPGAIDVRATVILTVEIAN